jgi:hypothetical protein
MIDLDWPTPNGWTVTTVGGVWPPLHDQAHQYRPRGPTVSGYSSAFTKRSNAAIVDHEPLGGGAPISENFQMFSADWPKLASVLPSKKLWASAENSESIDPEEHARRAKLLNHQHA